MCVCLCLFGVWIMCEVSQVFLCVSMSVWYRDSCLCPYLCVDVWDAAAMDGKAWPTLHLYPQDAFPWDITLDWVPNLSPNKTSFTITVLPPCSRAETEAFEIENAQSKK